jgi:hypothetical protein
MYVICLKNKRFNNNSFLLIIYHWVKKGDRLTPKNISLGEKGGQVSPRTPHWVKKGDN